LKSADTAGRYWECCDTASSTVGYAETFLAARIERLTTTIAGDAVTLNCKIPGALTGTNLSTEGDRVEVMYSAWGWYSPDANSGNVNIWSGKCRYDKFAYNISTFKDPESINKNYFHLGAANMDTDGNIATIMAKS